jgi:hypothetical protein
MDSEEEVPSDKAATRTQVLEAYRQAFLAGKPEWYRMRTAVLKNRLLDVTRRTFDEKALGFATFRDFVESLEGLVRIDPETRPVLAELLDDARVEIERSPTRRSIDSRVRVRPDLWDAVLDYTGATAWTWDPQERVATQTPDESDASALLMPTLAKEDLTQWRHEFLIERDGDPAVIQDSQVKRWAAGHGGSSALPPGLRREWFEVLKERVVDRLEAWFAEQQMPVPDDLLVDRRSDHSQPSTEMDALREYVHTCVRLMSPEQLIGLPIPAEIAFRAQK